MPPATRSMLKIVAIITLLIVALSIGQGNIPHSVHASPLSAAPIITVSGTCDSGGNATFTITNSGGDMPDVFTYAIFQETSLITNGSFILNAGDLMDRTTSGTYGNIRMDIKDDTGTVITSETTTCVAPTETSTITPMATLIPPNLSISASCETGGNATFTITNSGGNMPDVYTYAIFQETSLITNGSFILNAGDSMDRTTSGTFGNIRMDIKNDAGTVIASQSTTCVLATSTETETATSTATSTSTSTETPTSTNTATPTSTLNHLPTSTPKPAATSKPDSSVNNVVTSYFYNSWFGLYTATHSPTPTTTITSTTIFTSTQTSTVTITPNTAAKVTASTPVAFAAINTPAEKSRGGNTIPAGDSLLPWLGLVLIFMGSFFSAIYIRLIQK